MTWHVRAENLIVFGRAEEALVVYDQSEATKEVRMLTAPERLLITPGVSWEIDKSFLVGWLNVGDGRSSEITGFLQAMLDCAWKRGLRPSGYEGPQEVAAVRAHLSDMRKLAMGDKA